MIRTTSFLAALAVAAPALAQEVPIETVTPEQAPAEATPTQQAGSDGAVGAFGATAVRDLIGMDVLESSGADVGEVEALVRSGDAVQAVVGVGGFLGFGEHDVVIPIAQFVMTDSGLMLPDLSEAQLRGMPSYDGALEAMPRDVTVAGDPLPEAVEEPVVPTE